MRVFGYYYGFWLSDPDIANRLPASTFGKSKNRLGQSLKLKDLETWLEKQYDK